MASLFSKCFQKFSNNCRFFEGYKEGARDSPSRNQHSAVFSPLQVPTWGKPCFRFLGGEFCRPFGSMDGISASCLFHFAKNEKFS